MTETRFVTPDGIELPLRRWEPDGAPRAVVLALHGFNDYSHAFADIGAWLAERGIVVLAYDQRGFGDAPRPGIWPGEATLTADLRAALAAVRAAWPGVPVHVLAESMGGAVAMSAWAGAPLDADGVILVAPAVWGRATMPAYQTATLWVFAHTVPWMRFSGRGIKRHPSDNIEMLRALARDPLVIKNTRVDAIWGVVNLMDSALAAANRFDARALILLGAHDDIVPPRASLAMLERLPAAGAERRTVAVYPNGYHMLLRDLQAPEVYTDLLAWIDDPRSPLPSGADEAKAEAMLATPVSGDQSPPSSRPSAGDGTRSRAAEFMQ